MTSEYRQSYYGTFWWEYVDEYDQPDRRDRTRPRRRKGSSRLADGNLAEYALMPATSVTPAEGLSQIDSVQLAVLLRYIVPFGGLLRGRLAEGETLVVTGATGAYGAAAVLLAITIGAGRSCHKFE